MDAMHGIKREALVMKECLLRGDFDGIVESMREGWENKKRSATTVSNPNIDKVYDTAIDAGALAGKVSGAGGGGFMLMICKSAADALFVREMLEAEPANERARFFDFDISSKGLTVSVC